MQNKKRPWMRGRCWAVQLARKMMRMSPGRKIDQSKKVFEEAEIEQVYHQIGCNGTPEVLEHQ